MKADLVLLQSAWLPQGKLTFRSGTSARAHVLVDLLGFWGHSI